MFGTVSARVGAAMVLAVAIGLLTGAAAAAAPARPTAADLTFRNDEFQGVGCLVGHGCVAVGLRFSSSSSKTTKALAETRGTTGGSWTVHEPPGIGGASTAGFGPIGNGETLSCVAKPFTCLGIGSYNKGGHQFNYAATWNGKSWRTVNPPNPRSTVSSGLDAISCRSVTFCLVVGHWLSFTKPNDRLESLQWNGRKWTLKTTLPLPAKSSGARLWGLSCISTTWCMAVGSYNIGSAQPVLSEVWNGKKWTIHRPPTPKHTAGSALVGVSCLSKTFCNAVGSSLTNSLGFVSLGETWNGQSWVIRPTPSGTQTIGSNLFDVKCLSRTSCLAVGDLAATWNGSAWHSVHFPVPPGSPLANAVSLSCVSPKNCTAAGSYASGASTLTAAWNWNGTSLTLQKTQNP